MFLKKFTEPSRDLLDTEKKIFECKIIFSIQNVSQDTFHVIKKNDLCVKASINTDNNFKAFKK